MDQRLTYQGPATVSVSEAYVNLKVYLAYLSAVVLVLSGLYMLAEDGTVVADPDAEALRVQKRRHVGRILVLVGVLTALGAVLVRYLQRRYANFAPYFTAFGIL